MSHIPITEQRLERAQELARDVASIGNRLASTRQEETKVALNTLLITLRRALADVERGDSV